MTILAFVIGVAVGAFATHRLMLQIGGATAAVALHKAGLTAREASAVVDRITSADVAAAAMNRYDFNEPIMPS